MRLFPNAKRTKAKLLKEFEGKRILDVGCGQNKTPGTIGIDRRIPQVFPLTNNVILNIIYSNFPGLFPTILMIW